MPNRPVSVVSRGFRRQIHRHFVVRHGAWRRSRRRGRRVGRRVRRLGGHRLGPARASGGGRLQRLATVRAPRASGSRLGDFVGPDHAHRLDVGRRLHDLERGPHRARPARRQPPRAHLRAAVSAHRRPLVGLTRRTAGRRSAVRSVRARAPASATRRAGIAAASGLGPRGAVGWRSSSSMRRLGLGRHAVGGGLGRGAGVGLGALRAPRWPRPACAAPCGTPRAAGRARPGAAPPARARPGGGASGRPSPGCAGLAPRWPSPCSAARARSMQPVGLLLGPAAHALRVGVGRLCAPRWLRPRPR